MSATCEVFVDGKSVGEIIECSSETVVVWKAKSLVTNAGGFFCDRERAESYLRDVAFSIDYE